MAKHEAVIQQGIKERGLRETWLKKSRAGFGRVVRPDELVAFVQQFASMYEAGIPLLQCLRALGKQTENIRFKKTIKDIILEIEGGSTFSDSLAKHPHVFSHFFVSMVRAGEKAGIMDKILDRLALHIEKMQDLKRKIRGAFAYPMTVSVLAILVVIFLTVVIIPVFQEVYEKMNITLPLPTLIMIGFSEFLRKFGWGIAALTAVTGFLFNRYKDVEIVRRKIDRFKVNMPVFGKINRKAAVSKFIRTFGNMLESGVTISEAIETAKEVAGNVVISEVVEKMHDNIIRGKRLSEALEEQDLIPPSVVQMIAAGESSGTLPKMLSKSAEAIDKDLDSSIKRVLVLVEPILTLFIACFVAFIALAVYLPIFDVFNQIQQR